METHVYHITYGPETQTVHLFFWGCNMRCLACVRKLHGHDSHLAEPDGPQAEKPGLLSQDEIIAILTPYPIRRIIFLGDDPSTDPALGPLASALQERFQARNILLTNGLLLPPYRLFDEVQLSIKAMTPQLHRRFTGVERDPILKSFRYLWQQGVALRTESIVIPDCIEAAEIDRIAEFVASVDPAIPYWLDAYIPVPGMPWRRPTPKEMEQAAAVARRHLQQVSILHGQSGKGYEVVSLV